MKPTTAPSCAPDHYGTERLYAISLPTLLQSGKTDPEPGRAEFLSELRAVV